MNSAAVDVTLTKYTCNIILINNIVPIRLASARLNM